MIIKDPKYLAVNIQEFIYGQSYVGKSKKNMHLAKE